MKLKEKDKNRIDVNKSKVWFCNESEVEYIDQIQFWGKDHESPSLAFSDEYNLPGI